MKYDILIKNGSLLDWETRPTVKDIGIKDGLIARISEDLDPAQAREVIDAKGKLVMPGLVDTHVHAVRDDCTDEGFRMLLRAGVTTAIDFKGPVDTMLKNFKESPYKPNIAFINGVYSGNGFDELDVSYSKLDEFTSYSLENGAIGVKVLGGHFPVTNDTLGRAIEINNKNWAYIAIHCGNTKNGSNIKGFLDAVEMAKSGRLHIAHINSYCRGSVYNELEETKIALEALKANKNLISESYLSEINGTSGLIDNENKPKSHVTRNCLVMKGYEVSKEGLRKSILNGDCGVYFRTGDEMALHYGKEAVDYWESVDYNANICFDVNPLVPRIACAIDKDENNDFAVTAISTDGGAIPRNSILDKGLLLTELGGLSLNELSLKASLNPARMLGLNSKGLLKESYDADIIVVDRNSRQALYTIVGGCVSAKHRELVGSKGKLLVLENAVKSMKERKIDYEVIDLRDSLLYR